MATDFDSWLLPSFKFMAVISNSSLVSSGPPAVHRLKTRTNRFEAWTRVTIGEKRGNKPNKTILLVGEAGKGNPSLINALLNFSMGVGFGDEVWFQIVEEEEEQSQSESQNSDVVVYQIFGFEDQTLPFSLTIIDTPGYGDDKGILHDDEVSQTLLSLFQSEDGVPDLHAVGLVMKATDHLVSDRLQYIFNSVVSLFGPENTVALITHSDGMPPHQVLKALEKANIECSKDNSGEPSYFTFNNQQKIQRIPKNRFGLLTAWKIAETGSLSFARFLRTTQPKKLTSTFEVLVERARLAACVHNLQDRIRFTELKRRDIRLILEELKKHTEERKTEQLTVTVPEAFKDTEPIRAGPSAAVCCAVCEENCHYPGCKMGLSPIQCEVMKDGNCTSCSNKCPASYHVKDNQKYVIRTRKVQLSEITVAQKQEQNQGTIQNLKLSENLSKQMDQLLVEKFQLLDQAYQHVVRLHQIRSVHSGSTHVLLDFLIKKMKEKGDQEKLKKLEELNNKMDDRTRAALMEKRRCITSDHEELISDSFPIHPGPPAVYQLRAKTEKIGTVTRFSFGQKDATKPNKTILLVGETGAGKSTLIDVLLNYSMQVKFEDEVWFQITEQKESRSESQTSDVIVYQIYEGDALPFSLTVIDTPGFGNSRGIEHDVPIRKRLLDLFQSKDEIHELHAVGLVVKASENRLSDRLTYIYDSVMSLFGKDLEKKIVALITHSDGTSPENVIQVLEATNTKCAKDEQKQPLHFLLDSKQTSARGTAERAAALKYSWDLSCKHIDRLIQFLTRSKPQPLAMTNEVLNERIKLTASIQNLQDRIQLMEQKQTEIRQTKEALKGHKEEMRRNMEFSIEVDEVYKGQHHFYGGMWGVFFYNAAVSCLSCKRTCHFPCTMAWSPHTCDVMKNSRCTVCGCNVSSHVKQEWRYEPRTRKVQKTLEDVKRRYETSKAEFMKKSSLLESLEKESRTLSAEKSQLMDEAYFHVVRLEQIALQDDSLSSLVLLDFLTDQIREKSDARKVQKLQEMSRRMKGSRRRSGLRYMAATLPVGQKKTETFWVQ